MKRIIITLLALATFGGVASADRFHGPTVRDHRTGYVQRPAARYNNYNRGSYTYSRPAYRYTRPVVRVVRRPIYVQRPVIQYRYYNHYQRPTVIAENYAAMPGYFWVAGQWQWNGYEWIWQAGHYEPDPNYQTYDSGYYDSGYYPQQSGVSGSVYLNLGN
jgi:hypothetical protein